MIEKIEMADLKDPPDGLDEITMLFDKINQLVEACNRQDRAIAFLLTKGYYRSEIAASIGEKDEFYYREIKLG